MLVKEWGNTTPSDGISIELMQEMSLYVITIHRQTMTL